jgi:hypothetical protein
MFGLVTLHHWSVKKFNEEKQVFQREEQIEVLKLIGGCMVHSLKAVPTNSMPKVYFQETHQSHWSPPSFQCFSGLQFCI